MTPLLLIRHGLTEWNACGRIQGQTNVPLSPAARVELAGRSLPLEFRAFQWVVSPLMRAMETARLLGAVDPLPEPRLAEMSWGQWEGRTLVELRMKNQAHMTDNEARGVDFQPPGGESPRLVQKRLKAWLAEVASQRRAVVAVTHKGVIRAALALATGWDMRDKPPFHLDWKCAHLFGVNQDGALMPQRFNIELVAGDWERA